MYDIFTRTGDTTLLCDAAGIVKPGCCTCSQGQVLQQNCCDNVAEYSSNRTSCNMLQILGTPGYTCNRIRRLSQNNFEDMKLSVQIENRRCSHGWTFQITAKLSSPKAENPKRKMRMQVKLSPRSFPVT